MQIRSKDALFYSKSRPEGLVGKTTIRNSYPISKEILLTRLKKWGNHSEFEPFFPWHINGKIDGKGNAEHSLVASLLRSNMVTRSISLVALIVMIVLLALALPNYVRAFASDPPIASVVMSGLIIVVMLVGAAMLLLFGVIGVKGSANKEPQ